MFQTAQAQWLEVRPLLAGACQQSLFYGHFLLLVLSPQAIPSFTGDGELAFVSLCIFPRCIYG